ncbi:hypothetical protein OG943_10340 [Amycolatopsis sp. NBC_00345]|uniref:hypothetical protein n=1 Tax=Amycolatopsis sp. NBC_00345 TaxID=2975955 RepID=UPI002E27026F
MIFSDDPINDLGSTSPQPTAGQLITGIKQLITKAHDHGITFIRGSGSGCDGVVDQDAATHDPANPTWYSPS